MENTKKINDVDDERNGKLERAVLVTIGALILVNILRKKTQPINYYYIVTDKPVLLKYFKK